jgi:hypothetical protein
MIRRGLHNAAVTLLMICIRMQALIDMQATRRTFVHA